MTSDGTARVRELVRAARRLSDPRDPLGAEARRILPGSTGLSPEGVELALERCLETHPSESEIDALCSAAGTAHKAHVLLSASVFTAVHRAVALALAASPSVAVRPSRREPEAARLLRNAAGGLFECVDELRPEPGDRLWAYGSDETLETMRRTLPPDVVFLPHGTGIGIAVVDLDSERSGRCAELARALAEDVTPFDQRGCLSPRVVFVRGAEVSTLKFADAVARALEEAERRVPVGVRLPEELAAVVRYRETMRFGGCVQQAGSGWVGVDVDAERILVPPPGRNLHVVRFTSFEQAVAPVRRWVTAVGLEADDALQLAVRDALPWARSSRFGSMQCPPFDGPVDRRPGHSMAVGAGFEG